MAKHIIVQAGAPTVAPTELNQHYLNSLNGDRYISSGVGVVGDWGQPLGSGGGGGAIGSAGLTYDSDAALNQTLNVLTDNGIKRTMVADDVLFSYGGDTKKRAFDGTTLLFITSGPTSIARITPIASGVATSLSPTGLPASVLSLGRIGSTWVMTGSATYLGTSTDNGDTWTSRTNPSADPCLDCDDDGTTIIAVGGTNPNGRVLTSTDGITWTDRGTGGLTTSTFDYVKSRSTGNFIAVAANQAVYRSTNSGVNWTVGASLASGLFQKPIWDGTRWLFVCANGIIYQSTDDGATITVAYDAGSNNYSGPRLAWDGTTYYLCGTTEPVPKLATATAIGGPWTDQLDWPIFQDYPGDLFEWLGSYLVSFGGGNGGIMFLPSTLDDIESRGTTDLIKMTNVPTGNIVQVWFQNVNPGDTYVPGPLVFWDKDNLQKVPTAETVDVFSADIVSLNTFGDGTWVVHKPGGI